MTNSAHKLPEAPPVVESPGSTWESGESASVCYAIIDRSMRMAGIFDLTDGVYNGDEKRDYEDAQHRQAELLIDRSEVGRGQSLLDIGCGYGRILRTAGARGVKATGITVADEQATANRAKGLDAQVVDYRAIGPDWSGRFDGVIANGSIEHFVSINDVLQGRGDDVYRKMFAQVHRVIGRKDGCFVTTVIHFNGRVPDPREATKDPLTFDKGSFYRHWSNLTHMFQAWYPEKGQLEQCAKPHFDLVHEEDGTDDYRITSEYWLKRVRGKIMSPFGAPIWAALTAYSLQGHSRAVRNSLRCAMTDESWNWQFRGGVGAPTRLLRQVWRRRG